MTPLRIIPAVLLGAAAAVSASATDELWSLALEHTDPTLADKAVTMVMETYERNKEGIESAGTVMSFVWDEDSNDYTLTSAVESGKDVTDRERRRQERDDDGEGPAYPHQIFNPEKAAGLTLIPRTASAVVNGRNCRIYDFVFEDEWPMGPGKPKPVTEEGRVFIDHENGMPLRLESHITEGPDLILSFSYIMNAGSGPEGSWRLHDLSMDFVGRMIVYRAGGFRMRFEYGEEG